MSDGLKQIVSEFKCLEAEAKALRNAQASWPDQRVAYEKVRQAVLAYIVALPFDSPKLGQWVSYKTQLEEFLVQADREHDEASSASEKKKVESAPIDGEEVPEDWATALTLDKHGKPTSVPYNAALYLRFHPELRGKIRWDTFTKRVAVSPGVIADMIRQKEPTLEAVVVAIEDWLHAQTTMTPNHGDLKRRVIATALKYPYSSLADHLLLFRWDGEPRIERFLLDRCGARTKLRNGRDITEHLLRISRRMFISFAARGLEPGCQVDTVPVIEGPAGAKKTSIFRIIGGVFACETEMAIGGNKDSNQLASTRWIVELAEMDSIRNSSHTTYNAFITRRVDYYRPPYAAQHEAFPRICVLVGTTNKEEWIEDSTGDRRFWPVYVTKIDLPAIKAERDQLVAEAVHYFLNGGIDKCPTCAASYRSGGEERCADHRWWLDVAEQKVADGVTAERATEVAYSDRIREWWADLGKTALSARSIDPDGFTFADVAEGALKLTPDKWEREKTGIGKALKQMGFIRFQRSDGARRYRANEELRAWRDRRKHGSDVGDEIASRLGVGPASDKKE